MRLRASLIVAKRHKTASFDQNEERPSFTRMRNERGTKFHPCLAAIVPVTDLGIFLRVFQLSAAIAQLPAKQGQFSRQPHRPPKGHAVNQRGAEVRGPRKRLSERDSKQRPAG